MAGFLPTNQNFLLFYTIKLNDHKYKTDITVVHVIRSMGKNGKSHFLKTKQQIMFFLNLIFQSIQHLFHVLIPKWLEEVVGSFIYDIVQNCPPCIPASSAVLCLLMFLSVSWLFICLSGRGDPLGLQSVPAHLLLSSNQDSAVRHYLPACQFM